MLVSVLVSALCRARCHRLGSWELGAKAALEVKDEEEGP